MPSVPSNRLATRGPIVNVNTFQPGELDSGHGRAIAGPLGPESPACSGPTLPPRFSGFLLMDLRPATMTGVLVASNRAGFRVAKKGKAR